MGLGRQNRSSKKQSGHTVRVAQQCLAAPDDSCVDYRHYKRHGVLAKQAAVARPERVLAVWASATRWWIKTIGVLGSLGHSCVSSTFNN